MTRLVGGVAVALLGVASLSTHAQHQKPVEESPVFVDWAHPHPTTLEGLIAEAAVIVEGSIARLRPYDRVQAGGTEPFTAVMLEEVNWIKPTTALGAASVEFLLLTAERDQGDRIVRRLNTQGPVPSPGERYLLFLNPAFRESPRPEEGPYWLARGREAAFLIRDDIVVPAGQSELSKQLHNMRRGDLISRLRELVK